MITLIVGKNILHQEGGHTDSSTRHNPPPKLYLTGILLYQYVMCTHDVFAALESLTNFLLHNSENLFSFIGDMSHM